MCFGAIQHNSSSERPQTENVRDNRHCWWSLCATPSKNYSTNVASRERDPLFGPYLAAELLRATWDHETQENIETLLPSVALRAVVCSTCRATLVNDTPARSLLLHVA